VDNTSVEAYWFLVFSLCRQAHVNKNIDFEYKEYARQRLDQYWQTKPGMLGPNWLVIVLGGPWLASPVKFCLSVAASSCQFFTAVCSAPCDLCDHILGLEYAICNYVYPVAILHGLTQFWTKFLADSSDRFAVQLIAILTIFICGHVITVWHGGMWFACCLLRCTPASHGDPTWKFQLGMSLFKTAIQIVLHSCLVIKK